MTAVKGHAYGILDVREVADASGQPVRLLQIRNPWGCTEWRGPWSDGTRERAPRLLRKMWLTIALRVNGRVCGVDAGAARGAGL